MQEYWEDEWEELPEEDFSMFDEDESENENVDKFERTLQRLEYKIRNIPIPKLGEFLADLPVMVSLVRSFFKKEYKDIPIGTIFGMIFLIAYFVSPIDLIPDLVIPVVGFLDDMAILGFVGFLVHSDVKEYMEWRIKNNKVIKDL